ncbi:MAG: hypothetical protein MZW92_22110 [Comamonadaceae bacterium]|nr:hypothetical protein [Comamonadaceae bacterium]
MRHRRVAARASRTLVQDVLYPALLRHFGKADRDARRARPRCSAPTGWPTRCSSTSRPIGKTARSNPASYVGAFDAIRELFADAPLARERGYTAGTFSFNAGDGRCPTCGGNGFEHVEMQFLSRRLPALPGLRRPPLPAPRCWR